MKKFNFRLQAFLSYRKHLERIARQSVARTRKKISDSNKRIQIYESNQKQSINELHEKMAAGIKASQLMFFSSYHSGLKQSIEKEHQQHRLLLNELTHKQKILKQKSIEKKAIENLKARKKEEYYKDMTEYLQKETEDIIIMRKVRDINK